jgi:hypothetical protein
VENKRERGCLKSVEEEEEEEEEGPTAVHNCHCCSTAAHEGSSNFETGALDAVYT